MTLARLFPLGALLAGCNVTPALTTGGADLPSRGECPRGLAVVSSDYQSSEIALLSPAGEVVSPAFLSSASTRATGLAAPISGDITLGASHARPAELVVVDRFGTNVLTFVDTQTAVVRAQLPIGTGFESNPQGYLELDRHHAFVPRLGENRLSGREPFDAGSDVLVIDPSVPEISGSIPMPRKSGFLPNPAAIAPFGDGALVTLVHARADFGDMADSELAAISKDDSEVRYRVELRGLKNCGRAEQAPSSSRLVLACSGFLDRSGAVADPSASALVVLDGSSEPPTELARLAALDLVGAPLQNGLALLSDRWALVKTQTALGSRSDNQLFRVDLESGTATLLATAARAENGGGYGIAFGGISCRPSCGDPCFVTDASRSELLVFAPRKSALVRAPDIVIGGAGLPPIGVTAFW